MGLRACPVIASVTSQDSQSPRPRTVAAISDGQQLVAGEPRPSRQIDEHGSLVGVEQEDLTDIDAAHRCGDRQQQATAAVVGPPVELRGRSPRADAGR